MNFCLDAVTCSIDHNKIFIFLVIGSEICIKKQNERLSNSDKFIIRYAAVSMAILFMYIVNCLCIHFLSVHQPNI